VSSSQSSNGKTTGNGHKPVDNLRTGLLIGLAGFAALSVGDGIVKSMSGEWPGTAVAALRYCLGAIGLGLILLITKGKRAFHLPKPKMQLLRGFSVSLATVAFFSSIFLMPLATATSIQFTSPMMTAILSALFLGERIGRTTIIATALAFAGVMVVLRPGFGDLGWTAVLPILAALGMALLMIGNRAVSDSGSVLLMQFWVAAFASPILLTAATVGHFSGVEALHINWPHWSVIARCAFVAVTATASHMLVYMATMRASAANVAPMVYIQLLVAVILGMVFYNDWPDAISLWGAAMIVGAGIWLWSRTAAPVPDEAVQAR
jgi:drug/metabolite transporter (DMT)-like permease